MLVEVIVVSLLGGIALLNVFIYDKLRVIERQIADIREDVGIALGEEFSSDEEYVETESPISVQRSEEALQREKAFDRRIARIKQELDKEVESPMSAGTESEILADGLYNLPHNSIPNETNPPDEYAK